MRQKSRRWNLQLRSDKSLEDLSRIQPNNKGMDKLLRKLLQICAVSDLASSEHNIGPMGNEEIEEVERPSNEGGLLVGKNSQEAARFISALEDRHKADGWIMGAG